jgi:hypothetical protein
MALKEAEKCHWLNYLLIFFYVLKVVLDWKVAYNLLLKT